MTIVNEVLDPVDAPLLDDQSGDKFTHIVVEGFKLYADDSFVSASEAGVPGGSVVEAQIYGNVIEALCGKRWVPGDNPKRYPVCPTCVEIAEEQEWKVPTS